jgi:D-galactarolactone cycloisomerase
MKIKKISPISIHMPLINDKKKLEFNFVKIEMDNGIIGWGEAFGYISWKVVKTAIEEMIAQKLIK